MFPFFHQFVDKDIKHTLAIGGSVLMKLFK